MRKKRPLSMTKKERIQAVIRGEMTDRIPFTFWMEPSGDMDPEIRGKETGDFYHTFHVDLLKAMNPEGYSAEAFGALFGEEGRLAESPVKDGEDWDHVEPVSVNEGILLREQNYVKSVLDHTEGEVPVLFTVTSPLTTAFMMDPSLLDHIQEGRGEKIKKGLKAITETTCALVQQVIRLGADGIFFEARHASYDLMDEKTYREYGMPYDLAILSSSSGWCNAVHGHGKNIMFPLLRKYPADIFSWHSDETLPAMEFASFMMDKCLMTGLSARHVSEGKKNEIDKEIYESVKTMGNRPFILAPGCAVAPVRREIMDFLRREKEEIEKRYGDDLKTQRGV